MYTFYFADCSSPVQSFDIVECEDDSEARRRARELLGREPEHLAVEVWSGSDRLFSFEREDERRTAGQPLTVKSGVMGLEPGRAKRGDRRTSTAF
jgi:hypothetical protein